jgi:hypothetical protein
LPAMREKWGSKLTDFNGEPDHVHKRHWLPARCREKRRLSTTLRPFQVD